MEFLTVEEVAQQLRVTEKTVRDYCTRGELKAFKLGTAWRIKPEHVDEFLQSKLNVQDVQKGENENE